MLFLTIYSLSEPLETTTRKLKQKLAGRSIEFWFILPLHTRKQQTMSDFNLEFALNITIEYMPGKKITGGFQNQTNKPFIEIPEWLDSMDDTEYAAFIVAYRAFHQRFFPEACFYIPRMKTEEETKQEAKELDEFLDQLRKN